MEVRDSGCAAVGRGRLGSSTGTSGCAGTRGCVVTTRSVPTGVPSRGATGYRGSSSTDGWGLPSTEPGPVTTTPGRNRHPPNHHPHFVGGQSPGRPKSPAVPTPPTTHTDPKTPLRGPCPHTVPDGESSTGQTSPSFPPSDTHCEKQECSSDIPLVPPEGPPPPRPGVPDPVRPHPWHHPTLTRSNV